jgi:2-methylcitrate dehydratase PrpD
MTYDVISEFALNGMDIPETSMEMASTLLIDTLGVAAGAVSMEAGVIARNHAVRFHAASRAEDTATVLFDGRRASLSGAAFAAASQIDNLDAHDGYNPTKGHIGCAVVPALCAYGEHHPDLPARDALAALAMSYEVAARAAIALHGTVSDYHTSGAWNALGVAALGCRLQGLDADVLRHALGIAEYHGPRSQMMREIATPTMLHDGSGMGALVGMMAVAMAEDGFKGAPAITVEAEDVARYWADLGDDWTIEKNYIKPYPICRWAHAAIDGLQQVVREHGLVADDIAAIEVATFAQSAALFPAMPSTSSQAQYSLAFAMSAWLVNGHLGPDQITGAGLSDPAVADVVAKITVREDPRISAMYPAHRCSQLVVTLTDGRVIETGDVHARGGPEAPMAMDEVEAKFHVMAAALPDERRAAIWAMRARLLEPDARFSELLDLIHGGVA